MRDIKVEKSRWQILKFGANFVLLQLRTNWTIEFECPLASCTIDGGNCVVNTFKDQVKHKVPRPFGCYDGDDYGDR